MNLRISLVILAVVAGSAFFILRPRSDARNIRMAIDFHKSIATIDPANLQTADEFEIVRNLYGRLVEFDSDGQLVTGVPASLAWDEKALRFTFGNRAKTADGRFVTAQDAEFSLKRLLLKDTEHKSIFRKIVCSQNSIGAAENCSIHSHGNELVIGVNHAAEVSLFLGLLESAEFSILPQASVNESDSKIVDYRNTSGAYFVAEDSKDGRIKLQANSQYYHYDIKMPQRVEFVPVSLLAGLQLFIQGDVDLLPTMQTFSGDDAKKIVESGLYEVHETLPIKVSLVTFSKKAQSELSTSQKFHAAAIVDGALAQLVPQLHSVPTQQFFQQMGDGSLDETQLRKMSALKSETPKELLHPLKINASAKFIDGFRSYFSKFPEFSVKESKVSAFLLPEKERPDVYYFVTDSAWTESLNLIQDNVEFGIFKLPSVDMSKWIDSYLTENSRAARLKLLNKLHFDLLSSAVFVPLKVSPYFAAIKKPWKLNQSKLSAGTALWQLRLN